MPLEIEAKMRISDVSAVEAALVAVGAERGPVTDEVNRFYDRLDAPLRAADCGLRVRTERRSDRERPIIRLTYKGPRRAGPVKVRPEIEVELDDADAMEQVFAELGYRRTVRFEKRRRSWRMGTCRVEIDTLPVLGDFVEIEGPAEADVLSLRDRLGLGATTMVRDSYASMIADLLEREGDGGGDLTFDATAPGH